MPDLSMDDPDPMHIEPNSNNNNINPNHQPHESHNLHLSKPAHHASLMWVEKYRPHSLDQLLSHHEIINTLRKLISKNTLPHLLFCGPPGTGKTSTILACANEMYGPSYKSMILELNASDDRGISVVREQIKSFASTKTMFSTAVKLIILDEADAMTAPAQMALRRVVEKFAANTRFCIICNYVNKIIPALQSRCTKFRFGPLPIHHVRKRVREIAAVESVTLTDDGLDALLRLGNGDMRRILNIMQSSQMAAASTGSRAIDAECVYSNTGASHPGDIKAMWQWLTADTFDQCCTNISELQQRKGLALDDIVGHLLPHVRTSDFSSAAKMYLYEQLAEIEFRLAVGSSEKLNLAALIGSCKLACATSIDAMAS